MFGKQWTTKQKLIRNLILICLVLFLFWAMAGMPAITAKGAFHRAMQENLTPQVKPESVLKTNHGYTILGKDNGIWYQAAVSRRWWLFWDHYPAIGETEAQGDLYIVPLFLKDHILDTKKVMIGNWNIPDVAVLADGYSAKLRVEVNGIEVDCNYLGKQDGWFLFDLPTVGTKNYMSFANYYCSYLDRLESSPSTDQSLHGSFSFKSYDADGRVMLQQGKRVF